MTVRWMTRNVAGQPSNCSWIIFTCVLDLALLLSFLEVQKVLRTYWKLCYLNVPLGNADTLSSYAERFARKPSELQFEITWSDLNGSDVARS